jgi:hypothetical protein
LETYQEVKVALELFPLFLARQFNMGAAEAAQ